MKNFILAIFSLLFSCCLFSQDKDSAQYYYKKGLEEKSARLFAVAGKSFDKATLFDPNLAEAYIENGNVNMEMRRVDASLGNFARAYELQPSNGDLIKKLAGLYFDNRQFQKAIDMSQKCNDCPEAFHIMGMSYYNLEDYGRAESSLLKAINKDDKDADAAYTLGRTYLELENEKKAIPQYQHAIALEPDKNVWIYELGLIYYSQEDYSNALKYINMAGEKGYNKTNDYNENLGFAQVYTGDAGNGMKTLNSVLDKKPNNRELINNIAYAMYETKRYDDALTYYQKLLELNTNDASSLFMAGMAFQKKGEKEKGQKLCDKAIEMDPSLAKNRQKKDGPIGL
jgi:tetratricopeptide (TPR) repeat protein